MIEDPFKTPIARDSPQKFHQAVASSAPRENCELPLHRTAWNGTRPTMCLVAFRQRLCLVCTKYNYRPLMAIACENHVGTWVTTIRFQDVHQVVDTFLAALILPDWAVSHEYPFRGAKDGCYTLCLCVFDLDIMGPLALIILNIIEPLCLRLFIAIPSMVWHCPYHVIMSGIDSLPAERSLLVFSWLAQGWGCASHTVVNLFPCLLPGLLICFPDCWCCCFGVVRRSVGLE